MIFKVNGKKEGERLENQKLMQLISFTCCLLCMPKLFINAELVLNDTLDLSEHILWVINTTI